MSFIATYFALHLSALQSGNLTEIGVLVAKDTLIVFSILSVMVIIERAISLRRITDQEETDYHALRASFLQRESTAVRSFAANSTGPSALALQAGLDHGSTDQEIIREAVDQEIATQSAALQRNLPLLATVASTAPYIGLFGTVLGILNAFQVIAATGHTGASVVAGGISEALIATALGLGVAIPAVIAYNYFSTRVNNLSLLVESHAIDLASRLPSLQAPSHSAPTSGENDASA